MKLRISWFKFTLLNAVFIAALNFGLFNFIYSRLSFEAHPLTAASLPVIYFSLLCALFSLVFLPYLAKPVSIAAIAITCASSYFMQSYGIIIDSEMIRNVAQTDAGEVLSFLNPKLVCYMLFLGVLPCLLVAFARIEYGGAKRHIKIKFLTFAGFLALAAGLFFSQTKSLIPFFRENSFIRAYNLPFYPIYAAQKYIKMEFFKPEFKQIGMDATMKPSDERRLMVLIVGETARAKNYSLGGYAKNDTNFYTKNEPNLVYFSDARSCGTATAVSLPCLFSKSTRKEYSSKEFSENALDILKRVGVKVVWLGNNSGKCKGVCDRLDAGDVEYFDAGYDTNMLPSLKKRLENLAQNEIIVLHLQGSHGPAYYARYPSKFRKFTPTCDTSELSSCDSDSIVNTYDNTLLFTDFFIDEVINAVKDAGGDKSAVWYFSDHGESLGENGIYLHGMPYAIAPETQKHIPMMAYASDEATLARLRAQKDDAVSHDNVFSSLLGFFGVETKEYDKKLDIFGE
ncbi:phosphoethanolamine--lipid A transferase [uncultured Campylobacter sp.]|uniref:phosphoethanolamine transferase n=1 Tax=uncultured Campylobacter sp. TaxID=218934 RepID=UPI0025F48381|nr:phosphoethanolamine--lipid A transferase [uncultured Campylobacter sp.]